MRSTEHEYNDRCAAPQGKRSGAPHIKNKNLPQKKERPSTNRKRPSTLELSVEQSRVI